MTDQPENADASAETEEPEPVRVDAPQLDEVEKSDASVPNAEPDAIKVDSPEHDSVEFSEPLQDGNTFDSSSELESKDK